MLTHDRAYVCREIRTGLALLAFYEEQGVLFSVHKGEVRTAGDEELTCAQRDWIAQSSEHILLALRYRQKKCGLCGSVRDRPDSTWCARCVGEAAQKNLERLRLTVTQQRRAEALPKSRPDLRIVAGGAAQEMFEQSE